MKRGKIILKVLENIAEGAEESIDSFTAYMRAGYGASFKKIEYEKSKIERERIRNELEKKVRENYHKFMYALRKDGLVNVKGKIKTFEITAKGRSKLKKLRVIDKKSMPVVNYPATEGEGITIVSFDIPEIERLKRKWLREVLRNLDFSLVQQSFWIGKGKLPLSLLKNLAKMEMVEYLEIFQVSKKGTLKKL